jgi:hypothetical protein
MSNVLIGIIGVILFIGLALAGALILGDDFKSSSAEAKAAAISSMMQQSAQAINMYQLKTGKVLPSAYAGDYATFIGPRFIKTTPVNPVNGMGFLVTHQGGGHDASPAVLIYTSLGNDAPAKSVCKAIEDMAGTVDTEAAVQPTSYAARTAANRRFGCVNNAGYPGGMYQAYIPI